MDEDVHVPIAGGSPVQLNGVLVAGGTCSRTTIRSADGTRVVLPRRPTQHDRNEVFELYQRSDRRGHPNQVNGAYVATATSPWVRSP